MVGTKFYDNGFMPNTSFNSGQLVNIAWLVSPQIDMDELNWVRFLTSSSTKKFFDLT
jgi:hypothetical protein